MCVALSDRDTAGIVIGVLVVVGLVLCAIHVTIGVAVIWQKERIKRKCEHTHIYVVCIFIYKQ